jgi:Tol biopolymer transport system component
VSPPPPPDRLIAALADRYRIERELGAGGMATVYLAQDLKHDRKVALKVLKPELAAVLGAERFVVEIKTTASLSHPHILPLFDSGEADGFLFYVMPFVDGETLRTKLDRETQFGVDEAVRITTEVADALHYAHEHGVIHRDIKPENILLQNGRPMVADFGIALALSAAAGGRMTETGLSLGTPHYMSPEQATAEKEITARSDVYSLASVCYEMLAGQPPHLGGSAQQIIMKIIAEPVEQVTRYRKAVPPNVAAALEKALEKLPADRFASAKAFSDALSNSGFTTATVAMGDGGGFRSGAGVSRRLFGVTAGIAVVALGAASFAWLRPAAPVTVRRYRIEMPLANVRDGNVPSRIALTPDGEKVVYVGADNRLWVRDLVDLTPRALEGSGEAFSPFLSPDGTKVGFLRAGRVAVQVVSISGGPALTVADSGIGTWGASWSSDGYIYVSADAPNRRGIQRIAASGGGRSEEVTTIDRAAGESSHIYPVALPNGKAIVFTVQRGGTTTTNDIAVTLPGSGTHRILVRGVSARFADPEHLLYATNDGTLMAVAFDPDRLELAGDPVPILQGLDSPGAYGDVEVALSESGSMWYSTGATSSNVEPVWVTRSGAVAPIQSGWRGDINYPALSPDGKRVAFSKAEGGQSVQLWTKELDRGAPVLFAREGSVNFRPSWSPDGRSIAWVSDRGNDYDMLVKPADQSSGAKPLLRSGSKDPVWELNYAPAGKWLTYRVEGNGSDIYAIRPGIDTAPIPVSVTGASERMPIVSPDGRWIAYVSDATGRYEIFVRPFPNVKDAVWQVSTNGGTQPVWSHSGRELFYHDENDFVAVTIGSGAVFSWGEPKVLFSGAPYRRPVNGRSYDVAPGDQRFLMLRILPDTTASDLIVVENFLEELRRKVPR